jgi:hypothetical protein
MLMMHSKGRKMIIVMVEMRSVVHRLSCRKGCLQEAGAEEFETANGIVLLHHISFCKRRVVMAMQNPCSLNLFLLLVVFLFLLCPCSALQTPCRNVIGVLFDPN